MKHNLGFAVVTIVYVSIAALAQSAGESYQQALIQENGVGNLQNAIQLYQRAAKEAGVDRRLGALALLGVARCYEKLGQDESRKVYEEIVQSYPDQTEQAALAQARLARNHQANEPPSIVNLSHELEVLLARREELARRYTPQHPERVEVEREIADLQMTIAIASKSTGLSMLGPGLFIAKASPVNVDKPIKISGVVKDVQFVNPHIWITVEVSERDGSTRLYTVKGTNPRALVQRGITPATLKQTGTVTIEGFLATDGSLTIGGASITLPDGRKVSLGI
jgi:hypothetical protein